MTCLDNNQKTRITISQNPSLINSQGQDRGGKNLSPPERLTRDSYFLNGGNNIQSALTLYMKRKLTQGYRDIGWNCSFAHSSSTGRHSTS